MKNYYHKHRKKIIVALLAITALELIISVAFAKEPRELVAQLPLLAALTIASEVMFVAGILMMAFSAEHALGKNIFKWRGHLKSVIGKVNKSKLFWAGFFINFIGALGTGLIWLLAIVIKLPPTSWGLLWLPLVDILLTFSLRAAILDAHSENLKQ